MNSSRTECIRNNDVLQLFCFFSIVDEEIFYQYDLTRSKKLPTAVLDTYIRETMLWHYRPRRLKIKEEKAVGYQISQINNEWFFFVGRLKSMSVIGFWNSSRKCWAFLNTVTGEITGNSGAAIAEEKS